jgi:hypothetical protein
MLRLIRGSVIALLVASCASTTPHPLTVEDHEQMARHYEATADSIESQCVDDRRHELSVQDPSPCWKQQDVRFLEANRNAAAEHRRAAARLREAQQASLPAPSSAG